MLFFPHSCQSFPCLPLADVFALVVASLRCGLCFLLFHSCFFLFFIFLNRARQPFNVMLIF